MQDSEACQGALHNRPIDGSVVAVIFVEDRRIHDDDRQVNRGNLSRNPQPATVAPPPPVNPMTETYRYNTMAGEFVIDAAGRLTRRRGDDQLGGSDQIDEVSAGIGGGLLKAVRQAGDVTMHTEDEEEIDQVEDVWFASFQGGKFGLMNPAHVIDFRDI